MSDEGCVSRLTCVEAVLVSGAVAVKGEGGARESVACCCWDISELAAPMVTAPAPDVDPSAPEKTPVIKSAMATLPLRNAEHDGASSVVSDLSATVGFISCVYMNAFLYNIQ